MRLNYKSTSELEASIKESEKNARYRTMGFRMAGIRLDRYWLCERCSAVIKDPDIHYNYCQGLE